MRNLEREEQEELGMEIMDSEELTAADEVPPFYLMAVWEDHPHR